MDAVFLKSEDIDDIFKNHLKIESKVMSIESIFSNMRFKNKIIYDPYYQRNYVWDKTKATYFIESILLGTEIPPLVFFDNQEHIEIIDGRQRYETINKFLNCEFVLAKNGLKRLLYLKGKSFQDLDPEIKNLLLDTKIRLLNFSIVNEPKLDEKKEDLIKKEIFRRYNSGITPLKNPEIENAIYIDDDLTVFFKTNLKKDKAFYAKTLQLFFTERDLDNIGKKNTLDKVMSKIRHLLVLHNIPIKKYSTLSGRIDVLSQFYELLSNNIDNVSDFYNAFKVKIDVLMSLKSQLELGDVNLSQNKLVYECTFWMLTILENDHKNKNLMNLFDEGYLSDYSNYLVENQEKFTFEQSHFYKKINERYNTVARYFEELLCLNLDIYLDDYSTFKEAISSNELSNDDAIEDFKNLEDLRLNKPEPTSMTIEDICRQMNRDKFLIRPPYQREEVINKVKSSALIESIILGIKLPPVFIYRTASGINEVVDGQQRILSILGFIGEGFVDENGDKVFSEKNNFKLDKLNILSELNGKKYQELDAKTKDKILDSDLSVVTIDAKINPMFDKIDLFIRLNNKPYPIKDNSFEMWNSYVDKDVISTIRQNVKKHSSWFYIKTDKQDTRMANEELYTALAYLEYKKKDENIDDLTLVRFLNIYQKGSNINLRIKEKPDITKVLNGVTTSVSEKKKFIISTKNIESFIRKIKLILIDQNVPEEKLNEFLKNEINDLFSPNRQSRRTTRTTQNFYSLWIILSDINTEMVKKHRLEMKAEISEIYIGMRNINKNEDGLNIFKDRVYNFKKKYSSQSRKLILSPEEKKKLILKQNNTCPICKNNLFDGDTIEVDHINPLALGGRDGFLNLQVVHKDCNRKKRTN